MHLTDPGGIWRHRSGPKLPQFAGKVGHPGHLSAQRACQARSVVNPASLPTRFINGDRFSDLEGFYEEVSEHLIPGAEWGRNLDAFNDILRGGFGTPESGFHLLWLNSQKSQQELGSTFEELVEIIRVHGPDGHEAGDSVLLSLD